MIKINDIFLGKINSINISTKKGTIKKPVNEICIDMNGLCGDAHSGNWYRQVSLLSREVIEQFSNNFNHAVNVGEFAENITTENLNLSYVNLLDKFIINDSILEVVQIGKVCHGDDCEIFRKVGKCIMPQLGIFCRVIKGGNISIGDVIKHVKNEINICVIVVSDSVYSGESQDISGQRIVELFTIFGKKERFNFNISKIILSDDLLKLHNKLEQLSNDNLFDIIITTGGTGISDRDNTYDAIKNIIIKELPGVMDFVRVKNAYNNPNALLCRSVAGITKNKTLTYAVPGSVKAVEEYCDVILSTLKHSIFILNGITKH